MPVDLTKYNTAARICGHVFNYLKMNIQQHSVLNIKTLYNMGMKEIQDRCDMVYKKAERKGVACPISINVNSCVDNFIPDLNDNNQDQDTFDTFDIKLNDIVKIKLGVDIDGCIAMYCETLFTIDSLKIQRYKQGSHRRCLKYPVRQTLLQIPLLNF